MNFLMEKSETLFKNCWTQEFGYCLIQKMRIVYLMKSMKYICNI